MSGKHIVIDARIRRSSTGRYVDRLIEHLQAVAKDNYYTLLLQPDDPWQPTASNFSRVDCPYAQFSLNPLEQFGFARQLNSLKADLVHFPMNQQPVLYRGDVVTSTLDTTMLKFTRPGRTPLPIFWLKMIGYRFLFWYSNKRSKAIITITDYVKDELAQMYPFTVGKTTTTLCAAEPVLAAETKEPNIQNLHKFILYVGAAFPHKNLETLVKSFEILFNSQPELKLVLVGKKEYYYEQLEKFVAKSPARPVGKTVGPARQNIIFAGFVSDAELKWLYQNAEAYVFPSLSEGFGLPGLEAMVHGCPVVSSNATCLPEVYGDAAVYFDPENAEDMAEKIETVLKDEKLRKSLTEKGHKQAAKYSWRRMAEQTLSVYQEVLAGEA